MADMTREEAAKLLDKKADDAEEWAEWHEREHDYEYADESKKRATALRMGSAALRGWVKTADRLPTEKDADGSGHIVTLWMYDGRLRASVTLWDIVSSCSDRYIYWMPLPPLPDERG
jgi:hypothetical protein